MEDILGYRAMAIKLQLKFLELIAKLCREQRIRLMIVNMPLTACNKNLLKKDFYRYYRVRPVVPVVDIFSSQ